jgi:hypothetical protein
MALLSALFTRATSRAGMCMCGWTKQGKSTSSLWSLLYSAPVCMQHLDHNHSCTHPFLHLTVAATIRPRLQGSRLTAWELMQAGVPMHLIADNAAGLLMFVPITPPHHTTMEQHHAILGRSTNTAPHSTGTASHSIVTPHHTALPQRH